MQDQPIVGIGPRSPPITGPGLKNRYIERGLEEAGYDVDWVNTLERSPGTLLELARQYRDGERFLISASTKVRLGTATLFARKLARPNVDAALLPAGGSFASELQNLPPGIRGRYIEWFTRFDNILPETNGLATELTELLGDDVYVSTLPNLRPVPDNPPEFTPFSGTQRQLRLAYVGRIKETKGLNYLLSAISDINSSRRQLSLDVFGHFLEGDEYKSTFLTKCDQTPGATFHGKIDDGNVIPRLREYDVFAFPTYYPGECFPGVLVEAFAAGCLVIASDWNYNGKLVSDHEDGLLFDPRSASAIRETIEWLLDNPPAVDQYKRNSWEKAQKYSIGTVTEQLIGHLEHVGW